LQLYSLESEKVTPVTDGFTDDVGPTFDPEGKYLFFLSRRTLNPDIGGFELNFQFSTTDRIYAATLRKDVASPVAPESDEEKGDAADAEKDKDKDKDKQKDKDKGKDAAASDKKEEGDKDKDKDKKKEPEPLKVDLDGIGSRLTVLPVPAGRYAGLTAFEGKL